MDATEYKGSEEATNINYTPIKQTTSEKGTHSQKGTIFKD